MTPIQKMKAELKELAEQIRTGRRAFRQNQSDLSKWINDKPGFWEAAWNSVIRKEYSAIPRIYFDQALSHSYRVKHIVYCLARGRTYEQIEPKVLDENKFSDDQMAKMVAQAKAVHDEQEALRPSA